MTTNLKRYVTRFLVILVGLLFLKISHADDLSSIPTANIRLAITGAAANNRYFLCLPSVGCLSISAGAKGKVFKLISPITIDRLFLSDLATRQMSFANAPKSCAKDVGLNQTVTIKGKLVTDGKSTLTIQNLSCSMSKD